MTPCRAQVRAARRPSRGERFDVAARHERAGPSDLRRCRRCMALSIGRDSSARPCSAKAVSSADETRTTSGPITSTERTSEERVVGAAEQKAVDLGLEDRGEKTLGEHPYLIGRGLAALNEFDESRAGRTGELDTRIEGTDEALIGAARHGADGADHPDSTRGGDLQQRTGARFEHTDHRHVERGGEIVERHRRRGVAGDDHHLGVVLVHEPVGDLPGEAGDLAELAGTVGIPGGVAEVDEVRRRGGGRSGPGRP